MSFALPSVTSKSEAVTSFPVSQDSFTRNASVKGDLDCVHPLVSSEMNHKNHINKMNAAILRNTQGLHAPLRISMEQRAAKKIGRLPFLSSSNVMLEALTGEDIEMSPSDIFNVPEFAECMTLPHAAVEKHLGLY